jgi:transposase
MVKPLSMDIRLRVAGALQEGESTRVVARRFGVSVASVVRIGQLWRAGRGLMARKVGGSRPLVLRGAAGDALARHLNSKSDWTVRDLAAALRAEGIQVSHDTVWRHLRREGLSFKKNTDGQREVASKGGPVPGTLEGSPAPD